MRIPRSRFLASDAPLHLAHLGTTLWLFWGALFEGRLLFFRDLFAVYAPNYAFLSRSLREGVWPLWNPTCDAGGPFLVAYPVDLLLAFVGGFHAPLSVGVALHALLAMSGATVLARALGMGRAGAWTAGAVYGLSGFVLSLVNLVQLFEAAAWSPWVLAAGLRLLVKPSWRAAGVLAAVGALQVSTFGLEIMLQTALVGLFLVPDRSFLRDRRRVQLAAALALVLLASAPVWYGAKAGMEGTARGKGFTREEALLYSLDPHVLVETMVPRALGNVHAFSHVDFWGEPYFTQGYPYLLSLYLGPAVLVLALRAGRHKRLLALGLLGVLIALGAHGPLARLGALPALPIRGPQKFFFLTTLALALLAGFGVERARIRPARKRHPLLFVPGLALVGAALALPRFPAFAAHALSPLLEQLADPATLASALGQWPSAWFATGVLALAAAGGLVAGGRWALVSGVVAVLDLLIVNGPLNPMVDSTFYELRPPVQAMLRAASGERPFRIFAYGAANTAGLYWEPMAILRGSDVALYSADRQSLLPRTHVLDGLEGAYDVDASGSSPVGSTLAMSEVSPLRYREHHARLRLANVRYVLSLKPLPEDLVSRVAEAKLLEIQEPLVLYELRDPLPRAFWVPGMEIAAEAEQRARLESPDFDARRSVLLTAEPPARPSPGSGEGGATVHYERADAHTVRIRARTPPGYVVVLDGFHPDWRVQGPTTALLEADGRYQALVTPGGDQEWTLCYRPRWRLAALLALLVGLVGIAGCFLAPFLIRAEDAPATQ